MRWRYPGLVLAGSLLACAADDGPARDACGATCADRPEAGPGDVSDARDASPDAADRDATTPDARDATTPDARDAATDVVFDVAVDAATDAPVDAPRDVVLDAPVDAPRDVPVDAPTDAPTGGCVSGAAGAYVARFRWEGSGPSSTAYVRYEANTLPDTSLWRVSAASRSIGYTPVYDDTFLAEGGLDLSGTVFIDVQLSTVGLGAIRAVTLAVYGRSFNTTASGSFAWQTFAGTGAAPRDLVSNVAPYRWYRADATAAFTPGDGAVRLRITPGPSSSALVVSRVEVCFDAP